MKLLPSILLVLGVAWLFHGIEAVAQGAATYEVISQFVERHDLSAGFPVESAFFKVDWRYARFHRGVLGGGRASLDRHQKHGRGGQQDGVA